jgi:peptidoglycan-associated lipoprotein
MLRRFTSISRPLIAAGLAVGLLAGCQSDSGSSTSGDGTAIAGLNDPNATGTSGIDAGAMDPYQAALEQLTRVGDRVLFATDHYDLEPQSEQVLQQQAALLKSYPAITATIEGHADERGTREYNLALADRRAATVRNYLVALGIDEARLETVSYGKEKPECAEASEACWSHNRRGVTVINP